MGFDDVAIVTTVENDYRIVWINQSFLMKDRPRYFQDIIFVALQGFSYSL